MNTLSENIVPFNSHFQNFIAQGDTHRAPYLSQLRGADHHAPQHTDLNPLNYVHEPLLTVGEIVPFESVESAWFWFIQAQAARNDGAQIVAGEGPFGPVEMGGMFTILKVRAGITSYADPGWFSHPPGTVPRKVTLPPP